MNRLVSARSRRTARVPRTMAGSWVPCALALLAIVSVAVPLSAQTGAAQVGDRVRVTAPGVAGEARVGRVVHVWEGGLQVDFDGAAERALAWEDVSALEVSRGTTGYRKGGLAAGLLGGMAVGAISGYLLGDDPRVSRRPSRCNARDASILPFALFAGVVCGGGSRSLGSSAGEKAVTGALVVGLVGGLVGFVVGGAMEREVWSESPVRPPGTTVQPSVSTEGAFGLSLRVPLGSPSS